MIHGCDNTQDQERALAAFGLQPEQPLAPVRLDVWPEHWPAVQLFIAAQTQWAVGMSGVVGLRYEALPFLMDCQGIPQADRPDVLADLQTMELRAIELWRSKNK